MPLNQPSNRRRRRLAIGAASAIVAATMLSGCSLLPTKETTLQPPLIKPAAEKVDAVDVKKGTIERYFSGSAVVASSHTVPVFYKESGRLKEIYVSQGNEVKAGQLIAELDRGDLDLRLKLEKLNLERAQIALNSALRDGITGNELRLKQIDLEREQITMDSMQQQLDSAKLVAPISGEIAYLDTKAAGDSINGYTPLVTIADPKETYLVYAADDAKLISSIEREMPVEITLNDKKIAGKVLQGPLDAPITGNAEVDERNTKLLYVGISDPSVKIELGKSVQIKIGLQKKTGVVVIPRSGLRTYLGRTYVQVADGDRRKEIDVEPGIMTQTDVEIVKGLDEGMKVILNN
ncbi:efflux RND transporter periplasmic adaptor subunit [Paenibacillus rhizovicinus]|uniref:Efflux RND transporter periplasmic adaptor subunit n=1 Tax=Paenibacillus rhizovicinus TaxID=2704463 RepID=A0A6C0NXF0_9BACL|nr:efflux RND transporter periplasmic adaptor subunit [Paenibacillus rhizovicinus]QHW30606.1 efflux RND transporter periplasmic adaptor subunit [Paenibacillus rhizovicinus]